MKRISLSLNETPAKVKAILIFILGLSCGLTFPPMALSWLIFITLALFLKGLENKFIKRSFVYGYIFYLGAGVSFIGSWFSYYFRLQLGCGYLISYFLTMILCLYGALYCGVISSLYTRIKSRWSFYNLVLLFPSLWVLTELIRGTFFPRSWYALGYTQVNNLLFRGYFPLLGIYGVSWIIVALSGFVVYTLSKQSKRGLIQLISGLVIFGGLSLALAQIKYTSVSGKAIKVALLQPSIFSTKNYTFVTRDSLEQASQQLVQNSDAELLVLPEAVFGTTYRYLTPGYLERLNQLVESKSATLIVGVNLEDAAGNKYTGDVVSNNWNQAIYTKHNLVPFGEYNPLKNTPLAWILGDASQQITQYTPGIAIQSPYQFKDQKIAFNICYENTINDFVAFGAQDATILLNQSDLSWYGQTTMKNDFFQFSQARALENQKYFLQDGNTGDTAFINRDGEVESRIEAYSAGAAVRMVQGYSGVTPFAKMGNTPIWLLCILIIALAVILHIKK
jgi:apolipoprotein N-acyltransferase